jgi:hypothetical protein
LAKITGLPNFLKPGNKNSILFTKITWTALQILQNSKFHTRFDSKNEPQRPEQKTVKMRDVGFALAKKHFWETIFCPLCSPSK